MLAIVGSEDVSSCRKWDLKNVALVESYPTSLSHPSPCITQKKNIDSSFTPPCIITDIVPPNLTFGAEGPEYQNVAEWKSTFNNFFWGAGTYAQSRKQTESDACDDNWADFSEMRLPRCLSPLASEASKTTGISTQDPLRPLEFSSCLSASHVNLQSSPIQPQALSCKTNLQNVSCTSAHVNELHCSVVGKNSCPLRSDRYHNGEVSGCKSVQQKTKIPNSENDLLKGKEDNIQERQLNDSVVRGMSPARYSVETDNEPYRKKAKIARYPNGTDTQKVKVVNPCNMKIKNISHIDKIQGISNPEISEQMDCLKTVRTKKTVSTDVKSQENLAHCQMSQNFKCKGQDTCQKAISLVVRRGRGSLLQKRTCETLMEDLSQISKPNSSSAILNTSSSSSCHDLQVTQVNKECEPRCGSERPPKEQHPIDLAQTIYKVNDLTNECQKRKVSEPEMGNSFLEIEKVILDMNQNREESKQAKRCASLAKKTDFCDKIFHQSVFCVGTTVTQDLPINQLRSVLQTTDREIRTNLPPSLISSKKLREPPEPDHMNTKLMMDDSKQEKKAEESEINRGVQQVTDKPDDVLDKCKDKKVESKNRLYSKQVEGLSRNVNACLVNGNFVMQAEITTNTGLSIHEGVDLNAASHSFTVPPARDFNSNFGMDNNLQHESTTPLLYPFRPENLLMMEKSITDEQISESLCEVPVSNKPTEVKLVKTKELHIERTVSNRNVNLEVQDVWNKEKDKATKVRKREWVEISRFLPMMNVHDVGISDHEMDESAQLSSGHGDEVVAKGGNAGNIDVVESQISVKLDNNGEDAHEQDFSEQQVLRTEVEVMPPDEGNR